MKLDDWMLFTLTFLTGVVIGAYVYITTFKPTYAPEGLSDSEDEAAGFSVVGKTYGGLEPSGYIRPSFRVLGNGSYLYTVGGEGENALEPQKGEIPRDLKRALLSIVTKNALEKGSEPVTKNNCRSLQGGVDYEYRIVKDGIAYTLDTCHTALAYDDELTLVLEDIWNYLSGEGHGARSVTGDTPYEILENFLRERLSPYEN